MAHNMRKMNGKVGYFAIKVDLSKAYDRLNWNFIHQTLIEVGYPLEWIAVVMNSVTSVRTNVKWNGESANYFHPQQGIRQGDPISAYLFVICMDKLSHLITQEVQEGEWKPMRTGQQVSHEKTSIMFSKNVCHRVREELVLLSGFNIETPSLGKYLAKQLSFVGRVTLSKAVIEAIPIYPMMTSPIPKTCLNEIQKIQRAFIWGDEDGNRKYHAAIQTGQKALWIDVMKGKYGRQNSSFEIPIVRAQDSSLWKCLSDGLHNFHMYEFWAIGNGNTVKAWSDRWLLYGKSIEELGIVVLDNMQSWKVKDLVDDSGVWKLDTLTSWLPHNIISKLFAIVPPNNASAADMRAWRGTMDGNFSIASAYTMLCNLNDDEWDVVWRRIWRLQVLERVRSFIWLVRHDRLITNYRKSKMHICAPWCKHCVKAIEDTMHVLRDFPLAKVVWCNLMNSAVGDIFYAANLEDWITLNLNQDLGKEKEGTWSCVWAVGCHFLWFWRNKEAHGDESRRLSQPWQLIMSQFQHYQQANILHVASHVRHKAVVQIGWTRPEEDWIMLNTDGASRPSSSAGCGGLLRNSNGFKKIALHIDSYVVVHTLQSDKDDSVVGWRIIQEIRRLLAMDWEVKISHSYRESNACGDTLANLGCDNEPGMQVYDHCPASLSSLLLADVMGIATPRVISL
ncbi:ribonuclease H [Trifolium pratense]|uniref:Ribonuclease H n=1 Tax=Trifolium pratense TaxID=57577 RepID=A0A2K3NQT0_TRIPR|nr:ribonuclease H [Trifolium pratense]